MSRVMGAWDLVKEKMEFDERIVTAGLGILQREKRASGFVAVVVS